LCRAVLQLGSERGFKIFLFSVSRPAIFKHLHAHGENPILCAALSGVERAAAIAADDFEPFINLHFELMDWLVFNFAGRAAEFAIVSVLHSFSISF
jgi:hypothetical protein